MIQDYIAAKVCFFFVTLYIVTLCTSSKFPIHVLERFSRVILTMIRKLHAKAVVG
jgi:hypothetical protein